MFGNAFAIAGIRHSSMFDTLPAGIHRAVVAIDEKERKSRPIHTGFAERDCTEFGAI